MPNLFDGLINPVTHAVTSFGDAMRDLSVSLSKLSSAFVMPQFPATRLRKRAVNSLLIDAENIHRDFHGKNLIRNRKLWINRKRAYDRQLREWVAKQDGHGF